MELFSHVLIQLNKILKINIQHFIAQQHKKHTQIIFFVIFFY